MRETGGSCVRDLGKNGIADERVERSSDNKIDFVVEECFKVFGKVNQLPSNRAIGFNNDIDIAGWRCLSACIRSENANGCHAVFLPDLRQAFPQDFPDSPPPISWFRYRMMAFYGKKMQGLLLLRFPPRSGRVPGSQARGVNPGLIRAPFANPGRVGKNPREMMVTPTENIILFGYFPNPGK